MDLAPPGCHAPLPSGLPGQLLRAHRAEDCWPMSWNRGAARTASAFPPRPRPRRRRPLAPLAPPLAAAGAASRRRSHGSRKALPRPIRSLRHAAARPQSQAAQRGQSHARLKRSPACLPRAEWRCHSARKRLRPPHRHHHGFRARHRSEGRQTPQATAHVPRSPASRTNSARQHEAQPSPP